MVILLLQRGSRVNVQIGQVRTSYDKDSDGERAYTKSVSVLEQSIEALKERMKVAYDVNVSVSSASQYNPPLPPGNAMERKIIAS